MTMDLVICGLVQPPTPPKRHQVRDALLMSQWLRQEDLPSPRYLLYTCPSARPTTPKD